MPKLATLKIQAAKNEPIWANPEMKHFFMIIFSTKSIHSHGQRVPKWKIAHILQSKEQKNKKKTPKNESHKGLQNWPAVLQHPVWMKWTKDNVNVQNICNPRETNTFSAARTHQLITSNVVVLTFCVTLLYYLLVL